MGARKWAHIAQQLPRRNGKQCRERWHNHLDPSICREEWTPGEVRVHRCLRLGIALSVCLWLTLAHTRFGLLHRERESAGQFRGSQTI